jgi:predicted kinase
MKPTLIIIRGSPATGKSVVGWLLAKEFKGKVALLTVDEFRWIMTVHQNLTTKDYALAFDNYLYVLKNYLKAGYTIVTEDTWLRTPGDRATDIEKVVRLGKRHNATVHQILLKGAWKKIRRLNRLRPMIIPFKVLKYRGQKVYSQIRKEEIVISIDKKKPGKVVEEILGAIKA